MDGRKYTDYINESKQDDDPSKVESETSSETEQNKPQKRRSGQKSPATTLSGQSDEVEDFEPNPREEIRFI